MTNLEKMKRQIEAGEESFADKARNSKNVYISKTCYVAFISRYVVAKNGCWNWRGHKSKAGYGMHSNRSKTIGAHRVSYVIHKGQIPVGLVVHHVCNNPSCVNPDHLDAITQKENALLSSSPTALNKRKTHCNRGHSLEGEHMKLTWQRGSYRRRCTICTRINSRNRADRLNPNRKRVATRMNTEGEM
tara:strand:+ start:823 stop:1386 length:564 start_codon:yes stop_codon:yes gene_type:complete